MLIGLTGHSGARKTLVAKRLERAHGFARMHAGRPVKRAFRASVGMSKRALKKLGKDKTLADLGGKSVRHAHEALSAADYHIAPRHTALDLRRRLIKATGARNLIDLPKALKKAHVVIDGVRKPEEADLIHALGGQVWRADDGKGHNPALPMDVLQSGIAADRSIDTSSGDKGVIRAKADAALMECMTG